MVLMKFDGDTVDTLYNVTHYNSKILYSVNLSSTQVSNQPGFVFITTELQFNVKHLGNNHGHCKEGRLYCFAYLGLVSHSTTLQSYSTQSHYVS